LGEPRRALWALASGYPLHHAHGVRFAHLLARGSASIPLALNKKNIFLYSGKMFFYAINQ
jgi:hypothetical protein